MRLLLDTHALLWWLDDSPRLPQNWRDAITSPATDVAVSAASILEIAIKLSLKKLRISKSVDLAGIPVTCGFAEIPISGAHAAQVGKLPWHHRDPFDRLLVAQALIEQRALLSKDANIKKYDVQVIEPV